MASIEMREKLNVYGRCRRVFAYLSTINDWIYWLHRSWPVLPQISAHVGWNGTFFLNITLVWVHSLVYYLCGDWHAVSNRKWLIMRFVCGHHGQSSPEILFSDRWCNFSLSPFEFSHWIINTHMVFPVIRIFNTSIAPIVVLSLKIPRLYSNPILTGLWNV